MPGDARAGQAGGKTVEIMGKTLTCPFCGGTEFTTRKSLLNTRGATFLGFDWANRYASNYICTRCGYIQWFLHEDDV